MNKTTVSKSKVRPLSINRVVVLGAGVMGAQIAAHIAASGVRVHLLDLPVSNPEQIPKFPGFNKKMLPALKGRERSARAVIAMQHMKAMKPNPLYNANALENIVPGNFDDDFSLISEADWVIEAVIEKMPIKQGIHKRIAEYAKESCLISTNTSGLALSEIAGELSEDYQKRFSGVHFFNPPRYLKLVELIPTPKTDLMRMQALGDYIETQLGKGIVYAKDTVNFIANRIGVQTIGATLKHMEDLGLNIETVDALTGSLMGRPSSATFRTMDVVGIDTFMLVAQNVYERASSDPYREFFKMPSWISDLIVAGRLGQKSGGEGCYKKSRDEKGGRVILSYDMESKQYTPQAVTLPPWTKEAKGIPDIYNRLKFIMDQEGPEAELIWRTLRDTFLYSAILVEEIADGNPNSIDKAIQWGFNWEVGPFALWQGIGLKTVIEKIKDDGILLPKSLEKMLGQNEVFFKPEPGPLSVESMPSPADIYAMDGASSAWNFKTGKRQVLSSESEPKHLIPFRQFKDHPKVIASNESASLVELIDDKAELTHLGLVFHSKMNALDLQIIEMLEHGLTLSSNYDGLALINNHPKAFSAGANLNLVMQHIKDDNLSGLDNLLRRIQAAFLNLKYASIPVVGCAHGLTLGGGLEVSLHCHRHVLSAETYAGLVEVGIGLVPGAGGCKELALRCYEMTGSVDRADPTPYLIRAFMLIGMAQVSDSGFNAIDKGLFEKNRSTVVMAHDRRLSACLSTLQNMKDTQFYRQSPDLHIKVAGEGAVQMFRMMLHNMLSGHQISKHDYVVGEKVAEILCGGNVDSGSVCNEGHFLQLERDAFISLCQMPKTQQRIEHMLKTGKPLRN